MLLVVILYVGLHLYILQLPLIQKRSYEPEVETPNEYCQQNKKQRDQHYPINVIEGKLISNNWAGSRVII